MRNEPGKPDRRRSIEEVRAEAESGSAEAQLDLADRFMLGDGVERDPEAAYRWLRKAAEAGLAEAQSKVGFCLFYGHGAELDPRSGLRWFLKGLRGGYAKAGYNLGDAYWKGRHVARRPRRAWFFFSRAVALGQEDACYGLAALAYSGLGVPKDVPKSVEYLRRAVRSGAAEAMASMARLFRLGTVGLEELAEAEARALALHVPGDLDSLQALFLLRREATPRPPRPETLDAVLEELRRRQALDGEPADHHVRGLEQIAVPLLRLGAAGGDLEAVRTLARTLQELGGRKYTDEALYWLHGSSQRDPASARMLGQLYGQLLLTGPGDQRAAAWLALAAEESETKEPDGEATTTLAQCFLDGRGVPRDPALAILLTERAARKGFGPGARLRGEIAEDGLGVPPDAALATEWYRRSAELGDRTAMVRLAYRLFDGTAVAPDARQAVGWLEKGVAAGETEGCSLLAVMLFRGEGTAPEPARARRLFVEAGDISRLPALFTSLEDEALRFRRAATGPRNLKRQAEEAAADPASISADAALEAGLLIWNGEGGLVVDEDLAAELFRAAAEKGNAVAAACLSHALRRAEDAEGEAEWLERAAGAGLAGAMRHLAYRLARTGRARYGDARTLSLLESAAAANDAVACHQLAQILERSDAPDDGSRGARILELRRRAKEAGCWPEPPAPA